MMPTPHHWSQREVAEHLRTTTSARGFLAPFKEQTEKARAFPAIHHPKTITGFWYGMSDERILEGLALGSMEPAYEYATIFVGNFLDVRYDPPLTLIRRLLFNHLNHILMGVPGRISVAPGADAAAQQP